MDFIILTGLSGSGKSTALAVLEDSGFYCVDNMPVALLPKFLELSAIKQPKETMRFAFGMDLRESSFLNNYENIFTSLENQGYEYKIFFLTAQLDVILRRYKETRRHHPLADDRTLMESIAAERKQLEKLCDKADQIIDTSHDTVHDLKHRIKELIGQDIHLIPMRIHVISFGFKHGIPHDADVMMDVRFLKNPFFIPKLKRQNGTHQEVVDFVRSDAYYKSFVEKYTTLVCELIPLYEKEGKAYLTIAIGCTGGVHRSVVIAENVHQSIGSLGRQAQLTHRDINRVV